MFNKKTHPEEFNAEVDANNEAAAERADLAYEEYQRLNKVTTYPDWQAYRNRVNQDVRALCDDEQPEATDQSF